MQKPKTNMTSREAAALLLSGGATDDVETAELMDAGKILDPDKLERSYYRRIFGFDLEVIPQPDKHRYLVKDNDLNLSVTCVLTGDVSKDASKLSKACIKLKAKHDAYEAVEEAETV
jgi:hypothetical protein